MLWLEFWIMNLHAHLADLLGQVDAGGVHGQADQRLVPVS